MYLSAYNYVHFQSYAYFGAYMSVSRVKLGAYILLFIEYVYVHF